MKVDVVDVPKLLNERGSPRLADLILAYLTSHPDEVFRPKDKEELAAKVGWPRSNPIANALIELARRSLIGRVKVKQYVVYGKHETIKDLRRVLPEEVMMTKRERARRRLEEQK